MNNLIFVFLFLEIVCVCSDEKETIAGHYFKENFWYTYSYASKTESAFVGTVPSKSGFRYTCQLKIGVYSGLESVLKVENCKLFNRIKSTSEVYEEISSAFSTDVARHPVHFKFEGTQVKADSLLTHPDDAVYIVNLKRGILSSLQLEPLSAEEKQKTVKQIDLFGSCPVVYSVDKDAPDSISTSRDLQLCQMPQIYTLQMRFFSLIKRIQGGYAERETSESIYPFKSTLECQYKLKDQGIQSVDCVQQQAFKPTAYNGSVYATAVSEIQQSYTLTNLSPMEQNEQLPPKDDLKNTSFLFQYSDEENLAVQSAVLQNQLHELVKSYREMNVLSWPELYRNLVWFMRHSTKDDLHIALESIQSCHGNKDESCDIERKTLEMEYFVDGLLSCATDACLAVFSSCIKDDHISWLTSRYFLYDLALNHQPNLETVALILDICIDSNSTGCWLSLSVVINKMAHSDTLSEPKKDMIFKTILNLHRGLDAIHQNGHTLTPEEVKDSVRILKALGNIGAVIQTVYDTEGTLISTICSLLSNQKVPYKVFKAALQVLENMRMTEIIQSKLMLLTSDINHPSVIRTKAFSILLSKGDRSTIDSLISLVHSEQMANMKNYMVTSIQGLMENDQPDMKEQRGAWQKAIREDGRPLPDVDEQEQTRYLELSRYFKLPFSMTYYGIQIEFDLVHDPASLYIQSVVIRLNYYNDGKVNLLEVTVDYKGLDQVLDILYSSEGKGLFHLLSYLANAKKNLDKGVNPQFADFNKNLSDWLNRIIRLVNHPQFTLPEDMLTVKLFGYEVFYIEINDILSLVMKVASSIMGGGSKQGGAMRHQGQSKNDEGNKIIKTRSARVLDLTKVMPTLSGASLNMTVLLTSSMGINISSIEDTTDDTEKRGAPQVDKDIFLGFSGEFFGQMVIKLGKDAQAGMRMISNVNVKAKLSGSVSLEDGSRSRITPLNKTLTLSMKNVDGSYNLGHIRSKLYHFHDTWTEIPADKSVQTTVNKCTGIPMMLLTGNKFCAQIVYPDVKDSTTHAYFPLSGPFSADFVLSRVDKLVNELSMKSTALISSDGIGPFRKLMVRYKAPGYKLHRHINIDIDHRTKPGNTTVTIEMPETGVEFTIVKQNVRQDNNLEGLYSIDMGRVQLQMKNMTMFKALIQTRTNVTKENVFDHKSGGIVAGNRTDVQTKLSLAAPQISLDVNFDNLKEQLSTHINTKFHLKYYCSKYYQHLYKLHFRPQIAEDNNDTSQIHFENDAVIGYQIVDGSKLWVAEDRMLLSYPGQKFTLANDMLANITHAHRRTVITYIGADSTEETIEMNAHVKNESNATSNHFCYHMTLEHKNRYDIDLQGHLLGSLRKSISIQTDIHFKQKKMKTESNSMQSVAGPALHKDDKTCSMWTMETWNMSLQLDINAKPMFLHGQLRPTGMEFVWDLDLVYPGCKEQSHLKSDGAIGSYLRNTKTNFKYWFRADFMPEFKRLPQKKFGLDFLISYSWHKHADFVFSFHAPVLNTSYAIHFLRHKNNTAKNSVVCHMTSSWPFLNFDYAEYYSMVYIGSSYSVYELNHTLNAVWMLLDANLNSKFTYDNVTAMLKQDGYINIKHPALLGRTNISTNAILSKVSSSSASIQLSKKKTAYILDIWLRTPWVIESSVSIKQGHFPKIFIINWIMQLIGSTTQSNTIQWNPGFARKFFPIIKAHVYGLTRALQYTSRTLTQNLDRSLMTMVVPITNQTFQHYVSMVAKPLLSYLPLPLRRSLMTSILPGKMQVKNGKNTDEKKDDGILYIVESLLKLIMKIEAKMIKYLAESMKEPPFLVKHVLQKFIKPNLHKALQSSRISFTHPTLLKWKHFISMPSLTSGQKHLKRFIQSKLRPLSKTSDVNTALLYDNSEILTYDGKLYQITEESSCPRLLTADSKHADFAVVSSQEGLTVITRKSMVSLHTGGRVFLNKCNIPIALPYLGEDIQVTKKNVSRNISVNHDLRVLCDINMDHCNIRLKGHHNQTIGLMGNNDLEMGNDFKTPLGHITPNIQDFTSKYELQSSSCNSTDDRLGEVPACVDLHQTCDVFFNNADSPLAKCFGIVESAPFLKSCEERVKNCMPHSICPSVHAYISKCDIAGVKIDASSQLEMCDVKYPSEESLSSKALLDIVIVLFKHSDDDFCLPCINTFVRFLQTCDKTDVRLTYVQYDSKSTTLKEALEISATQHFRLHTQKVVTVIQDDQDITEGDYSALESLYLENDIILNVISKYRVLRHKGLVGLDWDQRIISVEDVQEDTLVLPHDLLIKLMSATKGALFNAMLLEKNRKTRMAGLVLHICERQAYSNEHC